MKQSYHTDFSIQFKLGLLNRKEWKNIPKSTIHSWKNRDFNNLIGNEIPFSDEKIEIIKNFLANQTLLKAAKGLFFVYSAWSSITDNVRGIKTLLRKNRESIIKTIDCVIPLMGLKHACKLFKISEGQFYAWKREVTCLLSPLNKCFKQSTQNISPSELQTVKRFVQNEQYKEHSLSAVYYEMMRKGKVFMSLTSFYKYAKLFTNSAGCKMFKPKQKTGCTDLHR